MEEKEKEISLYDIPYNVVIYNILIYYQVDIETINEPIIKTFNELQYYGYFKTDRSRKIFIFVSIKIREPQFNVIQTIPKSTLNLEIQIPKDIKHKYFDQIINKTNIKSLTIDGLNNLDKVIIDNFFIFKKLERLIIHSKIIDIKGWRGGLYKINYLLLSSVYNVSYPFDCKILSNFSLLKTIKLGFLQIENFEILRELTILEDLNILMCTITTKKRLGSCFFYKMPKLKKIILVGNNLCNIEFVEENEELTILFILNKNSEVNVKGISKCKNLERLWLLKSIKNSDVLYGVDLPKLLFLNLVTNMRKIERLGEMKSLRVLKLRDIGDINTPISNIDGLNKFNNLQILNLRTTDIENLKGINLPKLLYIDISYTSIVDLSPLVTSKGLLALEASNTKITNITVILPNLIVLNIDDCLELKSFDGIKELKSLEILSIVEVDVTFSKTMEKYLKNLKTVIVRDLSNYKSRGSLFVVELNNILFLRVAIESIEGISDLNFLFDF